MKIVVFFLIVLALAGCDNQEYYGCKITGHDTNDDVPAGIVTLYVTDQYNDVHKVFKNDRKWHNPALEGMKYFGDTQYGHCK